MREKSTISERLDHINLVKKQKQAEASTDRHWKDIL